MAEDSMLKEIDICESLKRYQNLLKLEYCTEPVQFFRDVQHHCQCLRDTGIAVLFFNRFTGGCGELEERAFADVDARNFTKALRDKGYTVRDPVFDFTLDKICEVVREIPHEIDDSHNIVLIFISSHGGCDEGEGQNDFIYGFDGKETIPIVSLQNILYKELGRCEKIKGKPKRVFLQLCRGTMVRMASDTSPTDFTFCYSTMPGYVSHTQKNGSIYVRELCHELSKHDTCDVEFMRSVNKGVSDKTGKFNDTIVRQLPQVEFIHVSRIVLNPESSQE